MVWAAQEGDGGDPNPDPNPDQEGGGGEVQDSRSLACILAVQEALRREGIAAPAGPRLVGELVSPPHPQLHLPSPPPLASPPPTPTLAPLSPHSHQVDPTMADLINSRFTGRKTDLLLPCDLASGTLVQFALQPELKSIYSELLSPEGKEVRPRAALSPPFTPLPFPSPPHAHALLTPNPSSFHAELGPACQSRPIPPAPTPTHPKRAHPTPDHTPLRRARFHAALTLCSPRRQVLLASPGSYVRDGEALGELSFATLYQRARARGEVALGVQVS